MSPVAASSICSIARRMSNGVQGTSPASTTWTLRKGSTPTSGLYGRSSLEDCRMWDGPKRAPGR